MSVHSLRYRHPRGLVLLSVTELWERFSFYGVRGLLVLFLIGPSASGGLGWTESAALRFLGWFVGVSFLFPVLGGWLADRWIGTSRAVLTGGCVLIAGYGALAAVAFIADGANSELAIDGAVLVVLLYGSTALIGVGTGLFKPNVTVLVGRLYSRADPKRDEAFLIFYLAMNLGVVLCFFVIGTLGEGVSWWSGFAAAAVAMMISMAGYVAFRHRLSPSRTLESEAGTDLESTSGPLSSEERRRIQLIAILWLFAVLFWAGFEQMAGSLNLFAARFTDRTIGDFVVPATWFQSLNPFFIIVLVPCIAMLWQRLGRSGLQLQAHSKFAIGLSAMAIAFVVMTIAASHVGSDGARVSGMWLITAYFLITLGELSLWTTSLAFVTKFAPARYSGLAVGLWYLALALGGFLAGWIGSLGGGSSMSIVFSGLGGAFAAAALVLFLSSTRMKRLAPAVAD
ncbi:MAG: peptide MFS transporter [Steroidobacteraceae bacterium]